MYVCRRSSKNSSGSQTAADKNSAVVQLKTWPVSNYITWNVQLSLEQSNIILTIIQNNKTKNTSIARNHTNL